MALSSPQAIRLLQPVWGCRLVSFLVSCPCFLWPCYSVWLVPCLVPLACSLPSPHPHLLSSPPPSDSSSSLSWLLLHPNLVSGAIRWVSRLACWPARPIHLGS